MPNGRWISEAWAHADHVVDGVDDVNRAGYVLGIEPPAGTSVPPLIGEIAYELATASS